MKILGEEFGVNHLDALKQKLQSSLPEDLEFYLVEIATNNPSAAKRASARNRTECMRK
jgi:hypothetical protein